MTPVFRRLLVRALLAAAVCTSSLLPVTAAGQSAKLAAEERLHTDWADLARYQEANARLGPPRPGERRVVFYGDSIVELWAKRFDTLFPG